MFRLYIYRAVSAANLLLPFCPAVLFILVHFSVISPDTAKDLQEKAKLAQSVLKPIERVIKPDDNDDDKKRRK